MIILGCDVGKTTGLCLLDFSSRVPRLLARSVAAPDALASAVDALLTPWNGVPVSLVGIENPTQVFAHGRAEGDMGARIGIERSLLVAREAAGIIKAVVALRAAHARVYEGQAHECRGAVIGRLPRENKDAAIKAFVLRAVEGWPAQSNDHERDAAVAALFADRRHRTPAALVTPKPKRRRAA